MNDVPSPPTTRLAPSPTGALHLGNARTFLVNWLLARRQRWKIVLRIEDIDGPRVKPEASAQLVDDLKWLGLTWDEGPVYQSARLPEHRRAVEKLISERKAYPCVCSRKEVELAASAPHADDGAAVYPGTCRDRFDSVEQARAQSGREPAIRFRVPAGEITFRDEFCGQQSLDPAERLGDFVIAKSDGTPAYQLAVVVDDAAAGVTAVVRGDDLLDSTPRQILLYRALSLGELLPSYWHLPLVRGGDGKRLAKRHGDTRLSHYRSIGVSPQSVLRLLAGWCGMSFDPHEPVSPDRLVERFQLDNVPKSPIIFSSRDERLLVGQNG